MRYALRNLLRRRWRTGFAMIGVAVAISVVVALLEASFGIRAGITDLLVRFRGDLLVFQRGAVGLNNSRLPLSYEAVLAEVPGVARVEPYSLVWKGASFAGAEDFETLRRLAPALGLRQDLDFDLPETPMMILGFRPNHFVFDRYPEAAEGRLKFSAHDATEIILGAEIARSMRKLLDGFLDNEAVPGFVKERVRARLNEFGLPTPVFGGVPYTVIGILETGSYQDLQAIVPFDTFQARFGVPGECSAYQILVAPGATLDEVITAVRRTEPQAGTPLRVMRAEDLIRTYSSDYDKLQNLILAIGVLAAIVGCVSVLNTMLSNVHERTREIGLLLAVGWSRRMVLGAILIEGFAISVLGGALGVGLGVLELEAVERIVEYDPTPAGLDGGVLLAGLGMALAVGLIGTLLPAWHASRLAPVEALRHE